MTKIVKLNPDNKLKFTRKDAPKDHRCSCRYFELDTFKKVVTCRQCGKVYEPFETLLIIAREGISLRYQEERIKEQLKVHTEQLNDINQQLVNAKARLRRQKKYKNLEDTE